MLRVYNSFITQMNFIAAQYKNNVANGTIEILLLFFIVAVAVCCCCCCWLLLLLLCKPIWYLIDFRIQQTDKTGSSVETAAHTAPKCGAGLCLVLASPHPPLLHRPARLLAAGVASRCYWTRDFIQFLLEAKQTMTTATITTRRGRREIRQRRVGGGSREIDSILE